MSSIVGSHPMRPRQNPIATSAVVQVAV
uniref:Uncharacterized protein n=1 Tax=Rhizophora mucronata TaxID=61149 RepID=A0A2P2J180_RHIMU